MVYIIIHEPNHLVDHLFQLWIENWKTFFRICILACWHIHSCFEMLIITANSFWFDFLESGNKTGEHHLARKCCEQQQQHTLTITKFKTANPNWHYNYSNWNDNYTFNVALLRSILLSFAFNFVATTWMKKMKNCSMIISDANWFHSVGSIKVHK